MKYKTHKAKIDRMMVYEKCGGHCAYCGKEITMKEMQVDHFNSKFRAEYSGSQPDNSFDNLMPACAECNRYKSSDSIETMRKFLEKSKSQLLKTQNLRILNRLGGFSISDKPIQFYFEQFNNQ